MRGGDIKTESLFSYVSCEARAPPDHPLRPIRAIEDEALQVLSPEFAALYSPVGRPSIPPEKLLRALLVQVFYKLLHGIGHRGGGQAQILRRADKAGALHHPREYQHRLDPVDYSLFPYSDRGLSQII